MASALRCLESAMMGAVPIGAVCGEVRVEGKVDEAAAKFVALISFPLKRC